MYQCTHIQLSKEPNIHTNAVRQTLAPALSLSVLARSVLPILHSLVTDQIPNIRFNVAKSYAVLIDIFKRLPENPANATIVSLEKEKENGANVEFSGSAKGEQVVREEIMPMLEKLMEDEDVDVRFFATTAAKAWTDDSAGAMET
jgi:serine/threonine-protein phosphatase 2A regulatory subunit A